MHSWNVCYKWNHRYENRILHFIIDWQIENSIHGKHFKPSFQQPTEIFSLSPTSPAVAAVSLKINPIRKSKTSVARIAEATSSLWSILFLLCIAIIHDLFVNSSMNNSHAFENTIGASPEIIFTSSPDFFMIFFILANGSECGPVFQYITPEYAPACLMIGSKTAGDSWRFYWRFMEGGLWIYRSRCGNWNATAAGQPAPIKVTQSN